MSQSNGPVPRPGILDIAAYVGGEHSGHIRLASNEGALGPSPKAMEAYHALATELHRYPDGGSRELRQAIASQYGLDAERIVCGSGSDELISLLIRAYAGPGDEVLYSEYGFLMYPIGARSVGATPVKAPERNLTTDVDSLLAHVTPKTRLVFVANPNNPTGTYIPASEMARLADALPPDVVLVIDAAYAEYMDSADYTAGQELVDRLPNVVMTRTFSKIYALGSLRIGWAYCPAGIADVLNRVRGPFNVSAASQAAGVAAIQDVEFLEKSRSHNSQWREWFVAEVGRLGLTVHPSVTNFVLVDFAGQRAGKDDAEAARQFLKGRGIMVRQMPSYGLPSCLRVSIGTGEEMRAVVKGLADFLAA